MLVQPPEELEAAIRAVAGQVACLVEPGIRLRAEGMWDKPLGGQLRTVQVATSQPISSNVEFTRYTDRYQLQLRIEEVHLGVGNRAANRDHFVLRFDLAGR